MCKYVDQKTVSGAQFFQLFLLRFPSGSFRHRAMRKCLSRFSLLTAAALQKKYRNIRGKFWIKWPFLGTAIFSTFLLRFPFEPFCRRAMRKCLSRFSLLIGTAQRKKCRNIKGKFWIKYPFRGRHLFDFFVAVPLSAVSPLSFAEIFSRRILLIAAQPPKNVEVQKAGFGSNNRFRDDVFPNCCGSPLGRFAAEFCENHFQADSFDSRSATENV